MSRSIAYRGHAPHGIQSSLARRELGCDPPLHQGDKVWLETYRANNQTPESDVRKIKDFFAGKGVKIQAA